MVEVFLFILVLLSAAAVIVFVLLKWRGWFMASGEGGKESEKIEKANETLLDLSKTAARQRQELQVVNHLTAELSSIDDLGDILDTVNDHLVDVIEAEVVAYAIYDSVAAKLDYRIYVNEAVGQAYVDRVESDVSDFLNKHSKGDLREYIDTKGVSKAKVIGEELISSNETVPKSTLVIPIYVDYEVIGVMYVSAAVTGRFRNVRDNGILEMIASVVSFSVLRLRRLTTSQFTWTESLVKNFLDGVVMFDKNGKIAMVNTVAEEILGEDKITSLEAIYPMFDRVNLKELVDGALDKGGVAHVSEAEMGEAFYEIGVIPIKNTKREVVGGAIVFHDIRDMKKVDKLRSDFMSIAAHDLRSPISAIKGFAQMIRHGNYGKAPTGKLGEAVQFIEEGSDRMISLINDFLTVTRINQGKFSVEAEPIKIDGVIKTAAEEVELMARDRPLEVEYSVAEDLPMVLADKDKIVQVLINLMDNAMKHMDNGLILIKAERDKDLKYIRISEHNTGQPIPEEDMPHIFDQYFKGSSKELSPGRGGGLGLGLSIVKMIVEAHKGTISVENDNPGVTFSFTLPVAEK